MRAQAWIVVVAVASAAGCSKADDPNLVEATPVLSTQPAPVPIKREPAADADVQHVIEQLRCHAKSSLGACGVLEGFSKGTAWDLTSIHADEARYFGRSFVYRDGVAAETKWVFMIVRKTALNAVSDGDLPMRVVVRDLEKSLVAENNHANKLWMLLTRDEAVPKRNSTASYVLSYASATWDSASPTSGESKLLHVAGGSFVRQGSKRALHVVQLASIRPGASGFTGTLSTFYPLTW